MKAILVVDIDDSRIPIKNESIVMNRGEISYRDLNNIPYSATIHNFCLKPLPQKKDDLRYLDSYAKGWNDCINELLRMDTKDLETKDLIDVLELAECDVEAYIPSEIIEEVIARLKDYDKLNNIARLGEEE